LIGKDRGVLIPAAIAPINPLIDVPAAFYGIQYIDLTDFRNDPNDPSWQLVVRSLSRTLDKPDLLDQVSESIPSPVGSPPKSPLGPDIGKVLTLPHAAPQGNMARSRWRSLVLTAAVMGALIVVGITYVVLNHLVLIGTAREQSTSALQPSAGPAVRVPATSPDDKAFPPGCDQLLFDTNKGTINGLGPTAEWDEIKARLPCFTGTTEEGLGYNYGGGIFYTNHDFYFYTFRDFIEVRSNFKGTVKPNIFKEDMKDVWLSDELKTKDPNRRYFRRSWGCLVLSPGSKTIDLHAVECANLVGKIDKY